MDYINPLNLVTDFEPENKVRYIPRHLLADYFDSPEPEQFGDFGIVSSVTETSVFVRYFRNGMLQYTPQKTDPRDLINDTKSKKPRNDKKHS